MLNKNIKTIRKPKGLSQQELAVKLNIVRKTVSKWEQGLSVIGIGKPLLGWNYNDPETAVLKVAFHSFKHGGRR